MAPKKSARLLTEKADNGNFDTENCEHNKAMEMRISNSGGYLLPRNKC